MGERNLNLSMDTLFPQADSDSCRVCERETVDGRWNYCSERCRRIANAVQQMFLWNRVRDKVQRRDDHTCQNCGLSREMWLRAYHQVQTRIDELSKPAHPKKSDHPNASYDRWRRVRREFEDEYSVESPNGTFHVDHIKPISNGGHPFDESNLQTLCKHCHHDKTAQENTGHESRPEITLSEYLEQ